MKSNLFIPRICTIRRANIQLILDGVRKIYSSPAFFGREGKQILFKSDLTVWTKGGGKKLGTAEQLIPHGGQFTHHDCGSGQDYGICKACGKGHGFKIRLTSVPTEN